MRKLASIQRVKSVEDIYRRGERADNIVIVKFEDVAWQCVGKRTDFQVGDLCVYVEVSTVLPEHEVFSFMEKVGHKVKTAKIWGQFRQCENTYNNFHQLMEQKQATILRLYT